MGKFDNYAVGALITKDVAVCPVEAMRGADFLVIECGWGTDYYENAPKWLDVAAALGIPAIYRMKMDPGPYQNIGFDLSKFPSLERDWHIKTLDRAVFNGADPAKGARVVHALLWDMTYYQDLQSGVYFTDVWMAGLARHLCGLSWQRHHLPYYYFCTQEVVDHYGADAEQLPTLFGGQPMSCFKKAFLGDPKTLVLANAAGMFPPHDTMLTPKGETVESKPDYLHGERPFLWEYAIGKFYIEGVTDLSGAQVPVHPVLYWGTPAQLYAELNFKAGTPVTPPPGDTIPEPPAGGGNDPKPDEEQGEDPEYMALFQRQVAAEERQAAAQERIAAAMEKFTGMLK